MSLLEPIRIGVLMDYVPADSEGFEDGYESYPDIFDPFRMVADEYRESGRLDRPVEFVFRLCNGLPRGRFECTSRTAGRRIGRTEDSEAASISPTAQT